MPNIRHRMLIGVSAEKIHNALTTQDGLSAWWTPDVRAKAEQGSIARFGFGPVYVKEMKITELSPRSVAWTCQKGAQEWVGTTISFKLDEGDPRALLKAHPEASDQIAQLGDVAQATLLAFSHESWREDSPMFAECSFTWGRFLRSLKTLCETGKGTPWPTQHRVES